jgi:hypothetical protein
VAKKQTRRTVSLGVGYYTRLVDYARANNASAAQVTEYALDARFATPLDQDAFRLWRADRARQAALQGIDTASAMAEPSVPAPYLGVLGERVRRREDRLKRKQERQAELEAARAERLVRKERRLKRAQTRLETGRTRLCNHCDGPHMTRFCPDKPYVPLETGSRGERAAKAAHDEGSTFLEAAERFGVTRQCVQQTFARLYPGVKRPRGGQPDTIANGVVVEMARAGKTATEIREETGLNSGHIYSLCLGAGVQIGTASARRAAMDAAVAAVMAGSTLGEAAADHGVSWGHLGAVCRQRGVATQSKAGPRDGRSARGAELVEQERISIGEAARRMRCSPMAVRTALARRSA